MTRCRFDCGCVWRDFEIVLRGLEKGAVQPCLRSAFLHLDFGQREEEEHEPRMSMNMPKADASNAGALLEYSEPMYRIAVDTRIC